MQLICPHCGNDFIFVDRTRESVCHYCPQCGEDWKAKRDIPLETWVDKKQLSNQKKLANIAKRR